jgi:hypothetical protein
LSEINIVRCKDAAPAFLRKWRKGAVEWIIFPVNEILKEPDFCNGTSKLDAR